MLDPSDLENRVQAIGGRGCGAFWNERDDKARLEMAQQVRLAIDGKPALGQHMNIELSHPLPRLHRF
jgi:hypothetical protein